MQVRIAGDGPTYRGGRDSQVQARTGADRHSPPVSVQGTNYYRDLQVDPCANPLVLQAAYRALARIFHPDVQGDDEEMKRINAAWEVLGDPATRAAYDRARAGAHRSPAQQPIVSTPPRTAHAATFVPTRPADHAGPPPGRPFGPVLDFGRFDGWSLGEVATVDPRYLEWLAGVPAGRALRADIAAVLSTKKGPGAVDQRRHYETNQRRQSEPRQPGALHAWAARAAMNLR
jgi:curved DNA-binding protein CbpA